MASGVNLPPPVYYPSCVVDLLIRYDSTLTANASGAAAFDVGVRVAGATQSPVDYTGAPLFTVGAGNDGNSFVAGRIPLKASVELASYRQASKFSLTFDYRDLPIDPRLVRSVGVRIYMDVVKPDGFAEGVRFNASEAQRRSQLIAKDRASILKPTADNLVLAGVVNNWSVTHRAGGSEITMDGQDNRALLLASPLNPDLLDNLELDKPIDAVVRQILSVHPLLWGTSVVADDSKMWPKGIVPSPVADGNETDLQLVKNQALVKPAKPFAKKLSKVTRVRMSADGSKPKASAKAVPAQITFWDLIVNYCSLCGAVPYFSTDIQNGESVLRIKPGRDLFNQIRKSSNDGSTPYPGAFERNTSVRTIGGEELKVRRLVFGHNVEELSYERKYSGAKGRSVKVVSLNTSSRERGTGKLLIAEYPSKEQVLAEVKALYAPIANNVDIAKVTSEAPSGVTASRDTLTFYKPGIKNQESLNQLAKDLYEELNRGEQGGSIKTKDLASFGGGNNDPDLLYLRPGDAVELLVMNNAVGSKGFGESPLTAQSRGLTDGTLFAQLKEKLRDENHAKAVLASLKGFAYELQSIYRVSTVKYDWDISSGVAVAFDFQNYVVARDQTLSYPVQPVPKPIKPQGTAVPPPVPPPQRPPKYYEVNGFIPALPYKGGK